MSCIKEYNRYFWVFKGGVVAKLKGNGEYTISIQRCEQTGETIFETWQESMPCTEDTTIKDIIEWYKKLYPFSIRVVGLSLTEGIDMSYVEDNDLPF